MKRKIILIVAVALVSLIVVRIDFPVTKDKVVGTYVNTNYSKPHCCVEAPHEPDTLILRSDFTYYSKFYGKGTYKLDGSKISWSYTYEFGEGGYSSNITNKLFEEPRIILNFKLDHYYRKIK